MRKHLAAACLIAAVLPGAAAGVSGRAAAGQPPGKPRRETILPRTGRPTLGGKQFWTDELFFHQWRIQRNARTNRFRLLDADNFQHASGGYVECRAKLEEIKRTKSLPAMTGKVVIVLHGLFRSRSSMNKRAKHRRKQGGYTVLQMGYASTQHDVAAHARALDRIVSQLGSVEEVNFVGHSMGNIVVRHYLHDQAHRKRGSSPDKRIGRFVMLAPPNHGSIAYCETEIVWYSPPGMDLAPMFPHRVAERDYFDRGP